MKREKQEDHGMRSKEQLEIVIPGSSSWTPCAPQGVRGMADDLSNISKNKTILST
jgi:hypothetical protein